jgi:hypothetical protein
MGNMAQACAGPIAALLKGTPSGEMDQTNSDSRIKHNSDARSMKAPIGCQ